MFDSNSFDYINILDKAADASWLKNQAIVNNIANVDTPGYKRQDVEFESILARKLGTTKLKNLDEKIADIKTSGLRARVYTDTSNLSYKLDDNNVDIDTENVELASNKIKYDGLIDSMNAEFKRLQAAIK